MALHVAARFTKTSNQWIQMVNAFNQALKVGSMGQPNSHVSVCIEMLRGMWFCRTRIGAISVFRYMIIVLAACLYSEWLLLPNVQM